MEENTELATSLHGDVFQRIPGENNLWTLIQANHSLVPLWAKGSIVSNASAPARIPLSSAVQEGRQGMTMPTRIRTFAV